MICVLYHLEAIKNPEMSGAFNAAITDDTTNASFSATFAKVYGYKYGFLMCLHFKLRNKLLLTGRRVSNDKVKS
jgi:hypothetical protein